MKINKFRSWNENDECFYYFLNGGYFKESGEIAYRWCFNWENSEQFSGLHDKNGKEIYEGDIVSDGKEQDSHCVSGKHVLKFEKGGFFPFAIAGWEGTMSIEDCEIIGDIHQNPELMK